MEHEADAVEEQEQGKQEAPDLRLRACGTSDAAAHSTSPAVIASSTGTRLHVGWVNFNVHVGNRTYLTNQAHLPEEDNVAVLAQARYLTPRKKQRIANAKGDRGLPTMRIVPRRQTRIAVPNLALST